VPHRLDGVTIRIVWNVSAKRFLMVEREARSWVCNSPSTQYEPLGVCAGWFS